MADLDVTKKLSVYHLLYRINLSFTNIVQRCRELQATRAFRPKYMTMFQGFAQELQAEINSELLETLSSSEDHDWYRYGIVRDAWEKYLRDPDDVFIHAEERGNSWLVTARSRPSASLPSSGDGRQRNPGKEARSRSGRKRPSAEGRFLRGFLLQNLETKRVEQAFRPFKTRQNPYVERVEQAFRPAARIFE